MKLFSPAFENGSFLPVKYTMDGSNFSPPFKFRGVPKDATKLRLILLHNETKNIHWSIDFKPTTDIITNFSIKGKDAILRQEANTFKHKRYDGPIASMEQQTYTFELVAFKGNDLITSTNMVVYYKSEEENA